MSLGVTYAILGVGDRAGGDRHLGLLACDQFSRPGPSAVVVVCYAAALVLISFTFRTLPMGIVYAIWSGIGMVMIVAIGWLGFGQRLDQPALHRRQPDPGGGGGPEPLFQHDQPRRLARGLARKPSPPDSIHRRARSSGTSSAIRAP